jgi:cAMP-dependent protein kinase regulator
MRTVRNLRELADEKLLSGAFKEALYLYCVLLEQQPLQFDVRLRVADTLLALGEVERAVVVYTSLARHAANGGYPLHALVALKVLSTLDPQFGVLLPGIAEMYAAGSPRLGRGFRVAPPDPDQPLPPELPLDLNALPPAEKLAVRAESVASGFEGSGIHYPELLAPLPLFSLLPASDFRAVLDAIKLCRVQPGTQVVKEGEMGRSFFILARGTVRVSRKQKNKERVTLAELHQGSIFGEMALLTETPRNATVEALTDCDLLEFDRDALVAASNTVANIAEALSTFSQERLLNNLLNTAPLFKTLDDDQRLDLMKRFLAFDAEPGTAMIREGEPGRGLFLVLRGEFEVTRDEGGHRQTVATLTPGDVFGEISLLNDEPTTATVTAAARSTVLFLGREYFRRLIDAVPEIRSYVEDLGDERMMDLRLRDATYLDDTEELDDDDIEILI